MNSSLSKNTNNRIQSYKHHGKDPDELRRRRNQYNVSLRKVLTNQKQKEIIDLNFRINVMNKFNLNVI
jgi:hypothetical protein